jgi:hypothetical protein
VKLSEQAERMLARGTWVGRSEREANRALAPEILEDYARAELKLQGVPESGAFLDFARRFSGRAYVVRGDGAPRFLNFAGAERVDIDDGAVLRCLQQSGLQRFELGLHISGAIYDTGGAFVPGKKPVLIASAFERYLEYEAVLDAVVDEKHSWQRMSARVPDGTARGVADRLGLAPVQEVLEASIGAWKRPGLLLRTRRIPTGESTCLLEAFAATAIVKDELSDVCEELVGKRPSAVLWNPG